MVLETSPIVYSRLISRKYPHCGRPQYSGYNSRVDEDNEIIQVEADEKKRWEECELKMQEKGFTARDSHEIPHISFTGVSQIEKIYG